MFAQAYWVLINLSSFLSVNLSDFQHPPFLSRQTAFHQLTLTIVTLRIPSTVDANISGSL